MDFTKYNVNLEEMKKELKEIEENGGSGNYKEVPAGTYTVKITKLELTETKKEPKRPMLSCWFKILDGEYENSLIFMNQVCSESFQIHICDEFLRSLDTGVEVKFDNFTQYCNMIMDIAEEAEKLEFELEYGETKKGFKTFKINEVFDVE